MTCPTSVLVAMVLLWGHFKTAMYESKPPSLDAIKATNAIHSITKHQLMKVSTNLKYQLQKIV